MPQHVRLDPIHIQPQQYAIPAYRRAHFRSVRKLPYRGRVCRNAAGLLFLPFRGVRERYRSQPRGGRISQGLLPVPYNLRMERCPVCTYAVPHLQRNSRREMDDLQHLPHEFHQLFGFYVLQLP